MYLVIPPNYCYISIISPYHIFSEIVKFLVLSFTPSIMNTITISTKPYALFGWGLERWRDGKWWDKIY